MIKTKDDLIFYLSEDKKRINPHKYWRLGLLFGSERCHAFRYVRALRKYEFALNNSVSLLGKIRLAWRNIIFRRLSFRYRIYICPNTVGYGLRIIHFGGGIIINCKKMGNYCGITTGVVVGNKDSQDNRAIIGNHVGLTIGCKVIGKVTIGNNVTVAPNSVVVKDVPDNAIVTGIPAKILKYKEQSL